TSSRLEFSSCRMSLSSATTCKRPHMKKQPHSFRSISVVAACCAAVAAACAAEVTPDDLGNGGTSMTGVAGSGAGVPASGTESIAGFTATGGQPPGTSGSGTAGVGVAGGGNTSQG